MGKIKNGLVTMSVRLRPATHRKLAEIIRRKPYLSLNALINQILEAELDSEKQAATA